MKTLGRFSAFVVFRLLAVIFIVGSARRVRSDHHHQSNGRAAGDPPPLYNLSAINAQI